MFSIMQSFNMSDINFGTVDIDVDVCAHLGLKFKHTKLNYKSCKRSYTKPENRALTSAVDLPVCLTHSCTFNALSMHLIQTQVGL